MLLLAESPHDSLMSAIAIATITNAAITSAPEEQPTLTSFIKNNIALHNLDPLTWFQHPILSLVYKPHFLLLSSRLHALSSLVIGTSVTWQSSSNA